MTHIGPYEGKIVDAETGKPIEGALIYSYISTESPSVAGTVSHYAGYTQTFSDQNGCFKISKLLFAFRPLAIWGDEHFIISKPEYISSAYTSHGNNIEESKENIIRLKKFKKEPYLKSKIYEPYIPYSITYEEQKYLGVINDINRMYKLLSPSKLTIEEYYNVLSQTKNKGNVESKKYSHYELELWKDFGVALQVYEQEWKKRSFTQEKPGETLGIESQILK
ncbi:carboxypeptidase-like regulatory domain-containing protein [Desulfocapsa sulfexigens]|uniref:carboxypeptidase-like regulatory domain-containing protein n=1 Tax=Desulfocapsa sulfexigens TaxID=65555 RepID=UPI001427B19B|nr:carboxypeptidase-like regulatory domain-containing protein [Desulfocapsa sulfexigens]